MLAGFCMGVGQERHTQPRFVPMGREWSDLRRSFPSRKKEVRVVKTAAGMLAMRKMGNLCMAEWNQRP